MAGIGFELRRLARQDTISSLVGAAGHAAVIAAGPWLFTILSLAVITVVSEPLAGQAALANFRVVVIYSFAASLVLSAPVTIVATRLVADALWQKRPSEVPAVLLAAYAFAVVAVATGSLALVLYFRVPAHLALCLLATSSTVALIWVALSFCGAVRDYSGVTWSFVIGLAVSVLASIFAAVRELGAPFMIWGFLSGLTVTFLALTGRILATFPHPVTDPLAGIRALGAALSRYRHLALGALTGTAGVWIDKWVFWFSPVGESVSAGLVHAPLYDSAMFIASLGMIPALGSLVVNLETQFFERYQHYYATIQGHGTIGQIEAARTRLANTSMNNLVLITVTQVGICAAMVLLAPAIIDALNLQFRQIAILRYGSLGAVFQFVLIAATSILLFFDRRRIYLGLQVLFLLLNAGLTVLTIRFGEDFYGVGYFLACLIVSFIAFLAADRTFKRLNYLTFIGNNPSVWPDAGGWGDRLAARIRALLARRPGLTPPAERR